MLNIPPLHLPSCEKCFFVFVFSWSDKTKQADDLGFKENAVKIFFTHLIDELKKKKKTISRLMKLIIHENNRLQL